MDRRSSKTYGDEKVQRASKAEGSVVVARQRRQRSALVVESDQGQLIHTPRWLVDTLWYLGDELLC